MKIKIYPENHAHPKGLRQVVEVFKVTVNGWGSGVVYKSYDAAVRVANAIADGAINPDGVVTIDYSECSQR